MKFLGFEPAASKIWLDRLHPLPQPASSSACWTSNVTTSATLDVQRGHIGHVGRR